MAEIRAQKPTSKFETFAANITYWVMQKLPMFTASTLPIKTIEEEKKRFSSGTAVWRSSEKENFISETRYKGMYGISSGNIIEYNDPKKSLCLFVTNILCADETDFNINIDHGGGLWPIYDVVEMSAAEKKKYKVK